MSDLSISELQRQLSSVEDLLALLVHVSDEKVPQLKSDIDDIVNKIQGGFDKEELAKQIRTVLNQIINQSDYAKLQTNIDTATKKMVDAVETSSRKVEQLREESTFVNIASWSLLAFIIGLAIGMGVIYFSAFKGLRNYQQNELEKYQNVINATDAYARFINASCDRKQSFSYFVNGANSKKFDCSKEWLSGENLLKSP